MTSLLARTLLLAAVVPTLAEAQAPATDPRWAPWLGCWQLTEEMAHDGPDLQAIADGRDLSATAATPGAIVCVTPGDTSAGVAISAIVDDKPLLTRTLTADASPRPVTETGCTGTQSAEWSTSGTRVFSRAQLTCEGQPARRISGLSMIAAGPAWIDIQMVEIGGRKGVRLRRYQRAADQRHAQGVALAHDRIPVSNAFSLEDVKEAVATLPEEVVQAALAEARINFAVRRRQLEDLDRSKVPDSITDLLVALTYPHKFVIERAGGGGGIGLPPDFLTAWPGWGAAAMYGYYAPFGYWYPASYYDHYLYPGFGWTPIGGPAPGPEGPGLQPTGTGRVVDGAGYTRIRSRTPDPAIRTGSNANNGTFGGSSGGSGNSSGSSGVSPGGYSGGGSSERTAVPRPGGGSR